jgi:acyl-CoA synthetase (AMP-forming)/AMP-acid ligase II
MAADPILHDFDRLAVTRPEVPLVHSPGRSASAREIERLSRQLAGRLASLPPVAGRAVALRSPNGAGFLSAALAIRRVGAAVLLVDASVPDPEEERITEAMGAAAVVRSTQPWPESHDAFEIGAIGRSRVELPAGTAWIKVTSGSSGAPSGVAFTSEALAEDDEALFGCMGLSMQDRLLAPIPWSHSYGLCSLAIPCLRRGVTLVLPASRGPWAPLDAAQESGASFFPTVPAFLSAVVALEEKSQWPASLRNVVSAGAPLSPETASRFRERFDFPVHAFYGSSETGGITFDAEGGAAERGTVGLPIPGVRVDVDEDGRVRVSGRALGLRRVPVADDRLEGGVFRTGDLGRFEPNGELRLLGRADGVINVRGKKVDPEEVERVIRSLRGVREAVVVGVPEPAGDCETIRAVVAGDGTFVYYERVVAWCRQFLAPHKVPRSVLVLPAIPRTARGKIDREALRRWTA